MKKINSIFLDLKDSIYNSKFEEFLLYKIEIQKEEVIELKNINSLEETYNNINSNLDSNLNKIIQNLEKCSEFINDYLEPKGCIKYIYNYLFDYSFGSLFEMRERLKSQYNIYDKILLTKDNKILDT
jgi:hypothetical protein